MKYKLVYIEWEDAQHDGRWMYKDEALTWAKKQTWIVSEVGWIMKEDKKEIILFSRRTHPADSEEQFGQWERIPKTWIRKRKVLKI